MKKKQNQSFEASLEELESIVRGLEEGELSLEKSLELFETGIKLARECQERLNQAERRIEVLLKNDEGNPALEVLDADDLRSENSPKIKKRVAFDDD